MRLDFYKEDNRWYVLLPEWPADKEALEMVAGADIMLDILAQGEDIVRTEVSTELTEGFKPDIILDLMEIMEDIGSMYEIHWITIPEPLTKFDAYLCPVTLFLFEEYPKTFYITKLS